MPRKLDYPRASFKACLELAEAVESLGGQCDMSTCADKMKKKLGGSFNALVGAATKFGLIARKQGNLYTSDMYGKMKLHYNDEEKQDYLQKFFLNVPSFKEIYQKYNKVKLPIDILDKALVREFGVDKKLSQRVAKYFVDGSKYAGLLNPDNTFNSLISENNLGDSGDSQSLAPEAQKSKKDRLIVEEDYSGLDKFVVHIYGKGMNSKIEINETEDLDIVKAMINKVKKNLERYDVHEKQEETAEET